MIHKVNGEDKCRVMNEGNHEMQSSSSERHGQKIKLFLSCSLTSWESVRFSQRQFWHGRNVGWMPFLRIAYLKTDEKALKK
jgi:hypothetical protein